MKIIYILWDVDRRGRIKDIHIIVRRFHYIGDLMPNTSNGLHITLKAPKKPFKNGKDSSLTAVFENVGSKSFSLTFWWVGFFRIKDEKGKLVVPGPGPVLPCGVKEGTTKMIPGDIREETQTFGCTQPAGLKIKVGWEYDLKPGKYSVIFIYENPAAHGHAVNDAKDAWKGRVETDPIQIVVGK
jgi:hypothetical protein